MSALSGAEYGKHPIVWPVLLLYYIAVMTSVFGQQKKCANAGGRVAAYFQTLNGKLMKLTFIFVLLSCQLATAQINFFPLLQCKDRTYTNATIEKITPATVTVLWDGNGVTVPITDLPDDLQTRY